MSRTLLVTIALLGLNTPVLAADLTGELSRCRGIDSLSQRLACYDRIVDGLPEVNVTSTVQPTAPAPTAKTSSAAAASKSQAPVESKPSQPEPAAAKPEELFGKSNAEVQEVVAKKLEIETVDQIASKVKRIQISPSKEYVVYLENGQVWRQKDKPGKWRIKVGETAIISKASFGSFLMKSDARKKSVRAERLR